MTRLSGWVTSLMGDRRKMGKEIKEIEVIRQQVLEALDELGISPKKVILFGSMARGEATYDSDCDLLIITDTALSKMKRLEIARRIRSRLAKLHIPSDIIVKSQEEVEYLKDRVGSVVREALREGVPL